MVNALVGTEYLHQEKVKKELNFSAAKDSQDAKILKITNLTPFQMDTLADVLTALNHKGIKYEITPYTDNGIKFKFKPTEEEIKQVTFKTDYNFCFRLDENYEGQSEVKRQIEYQLNK